MSDPFIPTRYRLKHVTDIEIVLKDDRSGEDQSKWLWAIQRSWRESSCLNREFEWEYQPSPSQRDDDFFARNRYSLDEAKLHCQQYLELPHGNS